MKLPLMQWHIKAMEHAMKKKTVLKTAHYGCMLAFAMLVSYIEALMPFPAGIPGMKLGLANAVIVFCIYSFGLKPALCINVCRVVLSGLLFGNMYSLLYSLAGALVSFACMAILRKCKYLGITGVSIVGGVMHNVGQLILAVMITGVWVLLYYLPVLLLIGAITGFMNGLLAGLLHKRMHKIFLYNKNE